MEQQEIDKIIDECLLNKKSKVEIIFKLINGKSLNAKGGITGEIPIYIKGIDKSIDFIELKIDVAPNDVLDMYKNGYIHLKKEQVIYIEVVGSYAKKLYRSID